MYRIWVEISLDQLAANYHAVRKVVGPGVAVAPVLKADAYRHGSVEVAHRLQEEGAHWLAVSNAEEGVVLRESGIRMRILVMGDFLPPERDALVEYSLTPVIHSLERLKEYDRLAQSVDRILPCHLKIDTGMGRLGVRSTCEELRAAAASAHHLHLEGLMTHFASAADFTTAQTTDQIVLFETAAHSLGQAGIQPALRHLGSSAAVAYGIRSAFGTMVRPGLAIYGYVTPSKGDAPPTELKVRPALTWKSRLVEIKEIPEGASVGYGATWQARRRTRLGIVAAGYADGIPHAVSNRGHVIVDGYLAPIVGAVSMDLITVDLTEVPPARIGDTVILLGRAGDVKWDADDIAAAGGTISYTVLCGIGNRVKRVYT
ncbi:alanine racemase [Paludibaculum fermentans]|uniref:Alanine racemase n=1 Tax=Paludibaculum fermentans TaxID=1473598 RepID=A0A7S7NLI1_PALFE|nr:alanine racemase [Paludibaculum fermentans]QOY85832.1 alanine racemase [Paludibaculum fermentans]